MKSLSKSLLNSEICYLRPIKISQSMTSILRHLWKSINEDGFICGGVQYFSVSCQKVEREISLFTGMARRQDTSASPLPLQILESQEFSARVKIEEWTASFLGRESIEHTHPKFKNLNWSRERAGKDLPFFWKEWEAGLSHRERTERLDFMLKNWFEVSALDIFLVCDTA